MKRSNSSSRIFMKRPQQGQSAVEMALLLPLLLLVLFGIIITAFMFYAYVQVSNAAREGTRAGSLYRITKADSGLLLRPTVQKAIYDDKGTVSTSDDVSALGYLSPKPPSFNIGTDVTTQVFQPPCDANPPTLIANQDDPQPGDCLSVNIVYSYTLPILSVMLPMFPQPIVIQRNVTMEIQ